MRIFGRELPLFAVVGGLGTATSWVVVTVLNFETLVAGSIWLALGLTTYVLYRRHLGLSLTETHKIVLPKPAVEHEVEYESILVAFEDANYSSEVVVTAVRLAARRRRGIHVLVTITVPPNVPIDAQMPELESRAATAINSAHVRGGRRVTGHWEKVRPGQAGRRIVEEAKDMRARAIVMSLPARRTGRLAVRKDARDRPRGASVPGHHRLVPRVEGDRAGRAPPVGRDSLTIGPAVIWERWAGGAAGEASG